MKVKVQGVKARANLEEERVLLKVRSDTDIGRYILGVSRYTDESSVSTSLSQTYWFPDKPVKQGDFVVVYSKAGVGGQFINKSESTTHTFYLGLEGPIWKTTDAAAILFEIGDWESKGVKEAPGGV